MATANQNAQGLVLALFNASAGGNLANLAPLASTASATNALGGNLVAVAALVTGKNLSDNTTFRDTLLANLQITSTNAAYANAKAWVDGQLATPGTDKGTIAGTAVTYLLSLTDATNPYYAAAKTFQTRNDVAVTWSTSAAGSSVLSATALIAQQATVDNYVAPPPPPVGVTTLTLTTGTDALVGTTGTETINGGVNALSTLDTFNVNDTIDGGSGTDTINLSVSKNFAGFTVGTGSMKGVEVVNLTNSTATDYTFNARSISDVTSYNISGPVSVTGITSLTPTVNLSNISTSGGITIGYDGALTTGTADAMTLGVNKLGSASVSATSTAEVDIAVTADGIETVNLVATGANFVNLNSTSATALVISGSGSLTLNGTSPAGIGSGVKTIDASGLTGALTVYTTAANSIKSIKGGAGNDTIRATISADPAVADLTGNATIDGGAGANILRLSTVSTDATVAYTMSNVQTLYLDSIATNLTYSASTTTGLTSITLGTAAGDAKTSTLTDLGSSPISLTITPDTPASTTKRAHTVSLDTTGAVTATMAPSTAAATTAIENSSDLLTLTKATSANVTAPINTTYVPATNVDALTANLATTLTVGGDGGFGSNSQNYRIASAALTSLTINNSNKDITDYIAVGKGSGTASLLNTLNITQKGTVTLTATDTLVALQSLTVSTDSAFSLATGNTAAINTMALSGSNTSSSVTLGALGGNSLAYGVTGTISGLANGFTATTVQTGVNQAISFDLTGMKGTTSFGSMTVSKNGTLETGSITINASTYGDGIGADTITTGALEAQSVTLDVTNDAGGAVLVSSGVASTPSIIAENVTIKAGNAASTLTVGDAGTTNTDISAKNSLIYTGPTTSATSEQISILTGSTAFTGTLNTGILADRFDFTSASTSQSSITLTGNLGSGSNVVNVTSTVSTATAGQTIDLSGLTNVSSTRIIGGAKNDTIKGTSGDDYIIAGAGADTITGGGGNDSFVLNLVSDTGAVGSVTKASDGTTTSFVSTYTVTAGDKVSTTGFDKITDFSTGDTIVSNAGGEGFGGASVVKVGATVGASSSYSGFLTGTYNSSAQTFTFSSSGADTLYEFDADYNGVGTAINAIVLIGYSLTAAAGATGIIGSAS